MGGTLDGTEEWVQFVAVRRHIVSTHPYHLMDRADALMARQMNDALDDVRQLTSDGLIRQFNPTLHDTR